MPQNIYDDPQFFQGYSQMARSIGGLDACLLYTSDAADE